jgi:alpha-tubulin suppressor-like RCC1 family protein
MGIVPGRLARGIVLGIAAAILAAPGPVAASPPADMVTAGYYHSCALVSGVAKCWGRNDYGQLGDGTTMNRWGMVDVHTSVSFTKIVAGGNTTCALGTDAKVYCWGRNVEGQIGDGTHTDQLTPVAVNTSGVLSGLSLVDVAVLGVAVCARSTTTIYCWGRGQEGDLGDGTSTDSTAPVSVVMNGALNGLTVLQMAAGDGSVCVLASDDNPYCWGYNGNGNLGDGSLLNRPVPTPVDMSGLPGVQIIQLSATAWDVCATSSTGTAYCWGNNADSQVGDATTTDALTPTAVAGLGGATIASTYAGADFSCARTVIGAAFCWGNNPRGQLGEATTTDSAVPVALDSSGELNGVTLREVATGGYHACAISTVDRIYCWGANDSGQVGVRNVADQSAPLRVQLYPAAPSAPQSVHVTPGNGSVTVSWTASAIAGSAAVTGYTATVGAGHSCTTSGALHCTIGGLTNGVSYTATVTAQSADGISPAGTAGGAAVPNASARLPVTGSATAGLAGLGLVLVAGGVALVFAVRVRRRLRFEA